MLKTTMHFFAKLRRINSGKPHLLDAPHEELLKGFGER